MKIRVLTAADLHCSPRLFADLAYAVAKFRPDVTALVGDFLDGNDPDEFCWTRYKPKQAAAKLAEMDTKMLFKLGNHDVGCWDAFHEAWVETGRQAIVPNASAVSFGPLVIVGFPCLVGWHENLDGVTNPFARDYESWLPDLLERHQAAARSLWLMHEPPHPQLCEEWAFSAPWREAIERYQPAIAVSGHDHRTPRLTGIWNAKLGNSVCINAGQRLKPFPGPLSHCILDFEFDSSEPSLPRSVKFERYETADPTPPF